MTDDELALADAYACLRRILQTGQSYEIDGRVYTEADIAEVRRTINELQLKVTNATAAQGQSNVLLARKGDWRRC